MKKINIQSILDNVDIIEVIEEFSKLEKNGKNYQILCKVHQDSRPSVVVSPEKQIFKCFSCGAGINVIDYLIKFEKFTYIEAIKYLSKKFDLNIEFENEKPKYDENQQKLLSVFDDVCTFFNYEINQKKSTNQNLAQFLKKRNLNQDLINNFNLGFADEKKSSKYKEFLLKKNHDPSLLINASLLNNDDNPIIFNRIIFPIKNDDGLIVALSSRRIGDNDNLTKYINSQESRIFKKNEIIYNFHEAKNYDEIILCEGFMDVIALHSIGIKNAIALMGLSLSAHHIQKLKDKNLVLFLDGDKAGQSAQIKIVKKMLLARMSAQVVLNSENKDPDELIKEYGANKLNKILKNRVNIFMYYYDYLKNEIDINNENELEKMLLELAIYFEKQSDIVKSRFISDVETDLNVPKDLLLKKYFSAKSSQTKTDNNFSQKPSKKAMPLSVSKTIAKNNNDFISNNKIINEVLVYSERLLASMFQYREMAQLALDYNAKVHSAQLKEILIFLEKKYLNPNYSVENVDEIIKILEALVIKHGTTIPTTKETFLENMEYISKFDTKKFTTIYLGGKAQQTDNLDELIKIIEREKENQKK